MGTAIDVGGGAGKTGGKKFVPGSRGNLFYLVRADVAHALATKDGELMPMTADNMGRAHVKDAQIVGVIEALGQLGITNTHLETLTEGISIVNTLKVQTKVVSCPTTPMEIGGIATGAHTANDHLGVTSIVEVPKSGEIVSATFWDLDFEGTQVDLEIFKHHIAQAGDNNAYDPSDEDILNFVTELAFFAFDSHISSYTSEIENIGKAYSAPEGKLWVQAVCRSTPDIDAGKSPRFQLQIRSDDPDWQEV